MSRDTAPQVLKEMKAVLGDKMILAYGTVLWLYRNGRLNDVPEDDEDTFMLAENYTADIATLLKQQGFSIYNIYPMKSGKIGEISFTKLGVKVDIYIAHKKGDKRYWAMYDDGKHYYHEIDGEFLEYPDKLEWDNEVWQVPRNIEKYLRTTYGDWETPVPMADFDWRTAHGTYRKDFRE